MVRRILFWITLAFVLGYLLYPLIYLLITGDFPGAGVFYGLQEDSFIVVWLLNVR